MKPYKDHTLEELLDELAKGHSIEKADQVKAEIIKRFRLLEAHSRKT